MIKKEKKLIITFSTTTDAMAMEMVCKKSGADGRIIPVPPKIYAGCGLAWCARPESRDGLCASMEHNDIYPEGLWECLV